MIYSQDYARSIDDVRTIVQHAKLDHKNLTNTAQAIYYPRNEEGHDIGNIKLLEVDEHILEEIKKGSEICFKGALNEKVVLCTESRTYEMKEAEISNSLLLVKGLKLAQATSRSPIKSPKGGVNTSMDSSIEEEQEDPDKIDTIDEVERKDVVKIFHDYFELRQVKPKYRKIIDLLRLTRYAGPENEHLIDRSLLFRFKQLLDTVQCSKDEFHEGLKKYRAIEVDDRVRMLDIEYEYRVLTLLLSVVSENSWELDAIDKDVTLEAMQGIIPFEVVDGMFNVYTTPSERMPGRFQYREDLVCAMFAEKILQHGLKFHIDEFLVTWQEALPEGFEANEQYLRGIGIIDREGSVPCVRGLNEADLPMNLLGRLDMLFRTKERWNLEQIEPYIECFATPTVGVTSILAKYTRSLVVKGVRMYVSKH
ncbi:sister chromatid cohesion protein DCC1 [Anopheles merus]|uniref:Sister chromatid cohesion protein DCC1 n=2 Tax=gambiae species complex TaxID=44542 RepID=A0A1S4H4Q0_ANOGA|nr:sister chromatid cohesion protein DCC1 [Anopheles coluzzii]XP_041783902.1 sister chromatid cohesion protein DCC1 [Anopheles merus]